MKSAVAALLLATGFAGSILGIRYEPSVMPPPTLFFAGLPVSGRLADARRAGFDDCLYTDAVHLRCRRHDVWFGKDGPYEGAVDFRGRDGDGGFVQLILWHPQDQYAVYRIADAFEHAGWDYCYTDTDQRGDQIVYTDRGAPIRVSMDISYYGKRRLRLIPAWNRTERRCVPDRGRRRSAERAMGGERDGTLAFHS